MYEGTAAVPQTAVDTITSLVCRLEDLSSSVNRSTRQIADELSGNGLAKGGNAQAPPKPFSMLERLRDVVYQLESAKGETSRTKRVLGLQFDEPDSTINYNNQLR